MAATDCPESGLCGIKEDGVCVLGADVIYVKASGMTSGACDTAVNGCTIAHGLTQVDGAASHDVLLLADGDYDEHVIVDGSVMGSVWMVADGPNVTINPGLSGNEKVLLVTDGATAEMIGVVLDPGAIEAGTDIVRCELASSLELKDVKVLEASGVGIVADDCTLNVLQSTVSGNAGGGIDASGGTLNVLQSTVSGNAGGGISVDGDFTIVNNFITFNGNNLATNPAVKLEGNGATRELAFNTIIGSQVSGGLTSGVSCVLAGSAFIATGNIIYHAIAGGPSVSGNCTWEYSDIEGEGNSGTNIDMPPMLESNTALDDNYHLTATSPCINMGGTSGPAKDIDDQDRPQPGNANLDIGADEFTP